LQECVCVVSVPIKFFWWFAFQMLWFLVVQVIEILCSEWIVACASGILGLLSLAMFHLGGP
jgi:hypothetical protein